MLKLQWSDRGMTSKNSYHMQFNSKGLTFNNYTSFVNLNCSLNYTWDFQNTSGIWNFYIGSIETTTLILWSYIFPLEAQKCPQIFWCYTFRSHFTISLGFGQFVSGFIFVHLGLMNSTWFSVEKGMKACMVCQSVI